jgi:hypothetical protein
LIIKKENIEKIRIPFRVTAGIVALLGFVSMILGLVFSFLDHDWRFIPILLPMAWFTHLTFVAATTGYPPKYMYWTSSARKVRNRQ